MQWGDMEVGFTSVVHPLDCTELYRIGGLPGGLCMCPHYGYVVEGAVSATYPNTDRPDEEAVAGEVYFFPAGHILKYSGPTKHIEFNPAFALQQCMDAMQRTADRGGA
ncbi:cupin domain-containing protein [Mycolicibacterium elephantis]